MGTALDRTGLEVLSTDECWALLAEEPVGRIAFVRDGQLSVVPVNHAVAGRAIVFRSAAGAKLSAAWDDQDVAFEVDRFDSHMRNGWSVVVRGICEPVVDPPEAERLDQLGVDPWANDPPREHWVRIRTYEISGRRITR